MFSNFFAAREYDRVFTFRVLFDGKTWDIDEHGALAQRPSARPNMKPLLRCVVLSEGGLENLIREATLIRAPQWKFGTDRLRVRSAVYSVWCATMEKDEYHRETLNSDVVCHDDGQRCLLERKWALPRGQYIRATTNVVAQRGSKLVVDKMLTIDLDARIVRNSLGNRGENLLVSMWYALKSAAADKDAATFDELAEDLRTVAENPNARIWKKVE